MILIPGGTYFIMTSLRQANAKMVAPQEMSEFIWYSIIFKNRLNLIVASALCLLYGMFNLQFREKFV
ncbi:hypothetical protein [Marivirga sp.]|uniref:hypothetical protein n=1 Tax=Marivirga sp. TaxID=2018662 RepID=UPI003DA77F69